MAFLRTKKIKGIHYLYRVESYREGGLPRQRVIAYLGRASGAAKTRATPKAKPKARTESSPRKTPSKPAGETGRRHMAKGKKRRRPA